MGKKKNKPNAFFNFMQIMKPKVEKNLGHTISYDQLSDHIGPEWRRMSAEEKAKFAPYKTNIPLDSFGVPLAVHAEIAERARKVKEDMIAGISNMIDLHVTGDAMRELEVVVVAVTDYIATEEGEVFPAEVSLVRLTLGGGLNPQQYHAIINPPPDLPLGYAAGVRTHADATHKLPIDRKDPGCVGTDSLHQVAADLADFLTQRDGSDRLCPVFTLEERLYITRTVFRASFGMEHVEVWCLENLLRAAFGALYPRHSGVYTNTHARDELVNSPNSPDYHPALGCKWHREERPDEVNHCSLNMAQRWGFLLLHALNVETSLGVEMVAGRHWPGPNPNQGVVMNLAKFSQKKNIRRHVTSRRTINTASERSSESDTETGSRVSVASSDVSSKSRAESVAASVTGSHVPVASSGVPSKSLRIKTWQEIEDGPKTPVLQCSEEFPSLGGGRKQPSKNKGRGGGSWGLSGGACGGPSNARTKTGENGSLGSDQIPPSKRNAQHGSAKGTGGAVSLKNTAACLVTKNNESSGGKQQGAADECRGGGGGSSCTTQMEEQLRHVDLNGGPSRTEKWGTPTSASVEGSKKDPSKQNGVVGAQQPSGQHARPAGASLARPTLSLSGIGRGRKK